jgi:hypothetical protein
MAIKYKACGVPVVGIGTTAIPIVGQLDKLAVASQVRSRSHA